MTSSPKCVDYRTHQTHRCTYLQLLVVEFSGGVIQGSAVGIFPHEPLAVTRLLTEDARLFTFALQQIPELLFPEEHGKGSQSY